MHRCSDNAVRRKLGTHINWTGSHLDAFHVEVGHRCRSVAFKSSHKGGSWWAGEEASANAMLYNYLVTFHFYLLYFQFFGTLFIWLPLSGCQWSKEHLIVLDWVVFELSYSCNISQLPLWVFIIDLVAVCLHSSPLDDILAKREILNVQTRGGQVFTVDYERVTLLANRITSHFDPRQLRYSITFSDKPEKPTNIFITLK